MKLTEKGFRAVSKNDFLRKALCGQEIRLHLQNMNRQKCIKDI